MLATLKRKLHFYRLKLKGPATIGSLLSIRLLYAVTKLEYVAKLTLVTLVVTARYSTSIDPYLGCKMRACVDVVHGVDLSNCNTGGHNTRCVTKVIALAQHVITRMIV